MIRTLINRFGRDDSKGGFAAFVTDEEFSDATSILLKSKSDDGKTGKETGETGEDDPDYEGQSEEKSVEILLYDVVGKSFWGDGGVSENDIVRALAEAGDVKKIRLFINSPGGSSPVAAAIYNVLTRHPAKVETVIDGLAASAASVVAMAGDKVIARTGSQLMIHPASIFTYGNADDHQKSVEILKSSDEAIASIYAESTEIPIDEIKAMVQKETWMSANEALKKGFVDEVQGRASVKKASVDNQSFVVTNGIRWPTNLFKSAPKNLKSVENIEMSTPSEIKNSDDIKRLHPDIHKEIFNSGVSEERKRIAELDANSSPEVEEIINAAKADGRKLADIYPDLTNALRKAIANPKQTGNNPGSPAPSNVVTPGMEEFRAAAKASAVNGGVTDQSGSAADKARMAAEREKWELDNMKRFGQEILNVGRN